MRDDIRRFLKKHQKLTITLLLALLVWMGEISIYFFSNIIDTVYSNRDIARANAEEIQDLQNLTRNNEDRLQDAVTEDSFNILITRINQERHSQVSLNDTNRHDIGKLTGRLDVLEKFIYKKKD